MCLDQGEELGEVRLGHHHDLAAERHDREAEHTSGVGQRRQREIDRAAAERITDEGQRRHRLQILPSQHDSLGLAGGASGPDDHRDVVGSG